ncbi:MAG TPA: zf-HC2 domain-containing protein [Anaerolineaceae bacterium]|nr:zf-HC2 domain-containing protein [Anaerolineaceae bacterium]
MSEHPFCQEIFKSLSDYFDGGLDEALCQEIESHLCECENCRIVIDTMRKTIDLYHITAPSPECPDGVRERLFKRLHLEEFLKREAKGT